MIDRDLVTEARQTLDAMVKAVNSRDFDADAVEEAAEGIGIDRDAIYAVSHMLGLPVLAAAAAGHRGGLFALEMATQTFVLGVLAGRLEVAAQGRAA